MKQSIFKDKGLDDSKTQTDIQNVQKWIHGNSSKIGILTIINAYWIKDNYTTIKPNNLMNELERLKIQLKIKVQAQNSAYYFYYF